MNKSPEVSVVMSVYNGDEHLRESVESILSQEGVDFEFIIVDDGSTDNSGEILDEYARRYDRIKVVHQENRGLTRALIRGCAEAKGEYIARQDADDFALPGKTHKMLEFIKCKADAAFVSCGTRFVGPLGEYLFDVNIPPDQAQNTLLTLDINRIRGVSSHGSVLFRRSLYERVGGYRANFYFAQDLDLWIRLAECGRYVIIPEVLHQTRFAVGSISGSHGILQIETAQLIIECARLRRRGLSEVPILEKALSVGPKSKQPTTRLEEARALYFIGSCLTQRGDKKAKYYFRRAVMKFPLHIKAALKLLGS